MNKSKNPQPQHRQRVAGLRWGVEITACRTGRMVAIVTNGDAANFSSPKPTHRSRSGHEQFSHRRQPSKWMVRVQPSFPETEPRSTNSQVVHGPKRSLFCWTCAWRGSPAQPFIPGSGIRAGLIAASFFRQPLPGRARKRSLRFFFICWRQSRYRRGLIRHFFLS